MEITQEIVEYVAHLSRIELEPKELERLAMQLQPVLDFIDRLKSADVTNVAATSHILALRNVGREDSLRPSLISEKALLNAPQKEGAFFVVPKVIE